MKNSEFGEKKKNSEFEHILCKSSYIHYIQNIFYFWLEFEARWSSI